MRAATCFPLAPWLALLITTASPVESPAQGAVVEHLGSRFHLYRLDPTDETRTRFIWTATSPTFSSAA